MRMEMDKLGTTIWLQLQSATGFRQFGDDFMSRLRELGRIAEKLFSYNADPNLGVLLSATAVLLKGNESEEAVRNLLTRVSSARCP